MQEKLPDRKAIDESTQFIFDNLGEGLLTRECGQSIIHVYPGV